MVSLLKGIGSELSLGLPFAEGRVEQVQGLLVRALVPNAGVGQLYRIGSCFEQEENMLAEVVGLRDEHAFLMPFAPLDGLRVGAPVRPAGSTGDVPVGAALLGRVVDAFMRPLDGGPPLVFSGRTKIRGSALPPLGREQVTKRMCLGIRSLDAFVPCGEGQRLGVFAGPGVGKSTLMGMIAAHAKADVIVMGLVGERGREVGHFVEQVLGDNLGRSVVVVATSDRPAPERVRAAHAATSVAEYFRDRGASVLLFVDSLTRLCMAQREIGLAAGEPPASRGYPPSAFNMLAPLLERAAPAKGSGAITGFYTLLLEGDDRADPIADAARGLLDGHISLSRNHAMAGQYPAVDILDSLSRLEAALLSDAETRAVRRVRTWWAQAEEARDLVAVGAYKKGADPELDRALEAKGSISAFLSQEVSEHSSVEQTMAALEGLVVSS